MSKEYQQQYYAEHKEEIKARARQYYKVHREEQRARQNTKKAQIRDVVLHHYGARCVCCGVTEQQFLTIDHIDNNGATHRRTLYGRNTGSSFYRWIIKNNFPDNLQVLCYNCNVAKGLYGLCPHQEKEFASGSC